LLVPPLQQLESGEVGVAGLIVSRNRILFYDGTGQRFAETKLSDAPDPLKVAA
jgi:hypothetical protein